MWAILGSNQIHARLLTCNFMLLTCRFASSGVTRVDTPSHLWHAQWHADGTHRRYRRKASDAPP